MALSRYPSLPPGVGTVSDVSVVTANGVSGSVATSTTTPAITLTLGDITPDNVTLAAAGKLAINSSSSAFSSSLGAPTALAADVELTLPATYGSIGQALVNSDGLGQLGWSDAGVSTSYVNNALSVLNGKQVADLVGVANVTLSGVQTLDGSPTSNAVTVLLTGQTDPTENGVWFVNDMGPWVRPAQWAGGIAAIPGSLVSVSASGSGVTYSNTLWFGEGDGSSTSSYQRVPIGLASNTGWGSITNVTPDKSYNASGTTVTELANVLGTLIAQLISQGILRT